MGTKPGTKTALITGVTGQDGALLARFLLDRGYDVHGLRLYSATDDLQRLPPDLSTHDRFHLHTGDMTDMASVMHVMNRVRPDEIYNLAAQSHVRVSFDVPESTAQINALGTLHILESIRLLDLTRNTRMYQASSSEMFGNALAPQNEETPFSPCSPYAVSKLAAYWYVRTYRNAYNIFASNGILFNHESPLRGEEFVTRKITRAVAEITAGLKSDPLVLGNLESRRDWGHARDYVRGMWMMLQADAPDDFVLATGETHSVREFVEKSFAHVGVVLRWDGEGASERGVCQKTGRALVTIDPVLYRPSEVHCLLGNAKKARKILGWEPDIKFDQLVSTMVQADLELCSWGYAHDIAAE